MQVQKTGNNHVNFQALNIKPRGLKAISEKLGDKEFLQILNWKNELANLRHFDLNISTIKDKLVFNMTPKSSNSSSFEVPINAFKQEGNKLSIWATELPYHGGCIKYNLRFPNETEAKKAHDILTKNKNNCKNEYNLIEWAVNSAKIINNAMDYMVQASKKLW